MQVPHFLQVFTTPTNAHGDRATIIQDEDRQIPNTKRQQIAKDLNTGETVFINNLKEANISIVHPQGEIGFAGVAALAASAFLTNLLGIPTKTMHARDGDITTWQDGDITWARASLEIMPPWHYKQLQNAEAVEGIKLADTANLEHTIMWAWIDEPKGLIRARTFAADWDIPEAQGNGSGAMVLAAQLKRSIQIIHGKGAMIFAKPALNGCADIGGRVIQEGE